MDKSHKVVFIQDKIKQAGGSNRFSLADVLLAMQDEPTFCGIDGDIFILDFPDRHDRNKRIEWNLRADSLENQSPETIEFLYSLLK